MGGGGGALANADTRTLHTTYLSATMWIQRDESGEVAVYERSEAFAVSDRRGLVIPDQLKEHPDEFTRYGKLLLRGAHRRQQAVRGLGGEGDERGEAEAEAVQ